MSGIHLSCGLGSYYQNSFVDIKKRCVKFSYTFAGRGTYQNAKLSVVKKTLSTRAEEEIFVKRGKMDSRWISMEIDVESQSDIQVNSSRSQNRLKLMNDELMRSGPLPHHRSPISLILCFDSFTINCEVRR